MGLNVFVNAQSMILPLICVPKSNLMTSFTSITVLSPPLGVQCAAMWFWLHPVGNAIPAYDQGLFGSRCSFFFSERHRGGNKKDSI